MSAESESDTTETIEDIDDQSDGHPEPDTATGDDEPDISGGIASVPDELSDDIESDSGLSARNENESDENETESETDTTDADHDGDTYGDLYAKTLVSLTNAAIDSHGKEDAEKVSVEATRQLDIPDHADRLADEIGIGSDLPPGQALLASSSIFLLMNITAKTDLPQKMLSEMDAFDMDF